jgi:hypothetical protein
MSDFKLSDDFITNYKGKQPNWGSIGYVTFKRTYARPLDDGSTEEYWQTCQRVVEGVFSIQKKHCQNLNLEWNAWKAQKSAQRMFELMWEFKFTPPGRGFWMMGTDYIEKRGIAALQNCFSGEETLITKEYGPVTFHELNDGEEVTVLGKNGWTRATKQSFGMDAVNEIVLTPTIDGNRRCRTNFKRRVIATRNHKWILTDGSETTSLNVGDTIPSIANTGIENVN